MGARLVDIRLNFVQKIGQSDGVDVSTTSVISIRSVLDSDLPALEQIAAVSHRHTWFYADPHFTDDRCDRLYATWIDRSCKGYAATVLVAGNDRPMGYITLHRETAAAARVGLFAVGEQHRGCGIGR